MHILEAAHLTTPTPTPTSPCTEQKTKVHAKRVIAALCVGISLLLQQLWVSSNNIPPLDWRSNSANASGAVLSLDRYRDVWSERESENLFLIRFDWIELKFDQFTRLKGGTDERRVQGGGGVISSLNSLSSEGSVETSWWSMSTFCSSCFQVTRSPPARTGWWKFSS